MSHTPNELTEFFPAETLHAMEANPHFARLSADYFEVNREIHKGETNVEPMDDFHLEDLRKRRLALLDEIKGMISAASKG